MDMPFFGLPVHRNECWFVCLTGKFTDVLWAYLSCNNTNILVVGKKMNLDSRSFMVLVSVLDG